MKSKKHIGRRIFFTDREPYFYEITENKPILGFWGHPKQEAVLDAIHSPARVTLIQAAAQSGKSALSAKWLENVILTDKGPGRYLCGAPEYINLEAGLLHYIKWYFCELKRWGTYNKKDNHLVFNQRGKKAIHDALVKQGKRIPNSLHTIIYFRHAGKPEGWRGFTLKGVIIDEAASIKPSVAEEIFTEGVFNRVRNYKGKVLLMSTPNYLDYFTDMYEKYEDGHDPEFKCFNFTAYDHPNHDLAFIEQCKKTFAPHVFDREILGKATRASGVVLPFYHNGILETTPKKTPASHRIFFSADPGTVHFAALAGVVDPTKRGVRIVAEHYYDQHTAHAPQQTEDIVRILAAKTAKKLPMEHAIYGEDIAKRHPETIIKNRMVEQSFVGAADVPLDVKTRQEWNRMLPSRGAPAGKKGYESYGLKLVNRWLSQGMIVIDPSCTELIKACKSVAFKKGSIKDEVDEESGNVHIIDALRYLIVGLSHTVDMGQTSGIETLHDPKNPLWKKGAPGFDREQEVSKIFEPVYW